MTTETILYSVTNFHVYTITESSYVTFIFPFGMFKIVDFVLNDYIKIIQYY